MGELSVLSVKIGNLDNLQSRGEEIRQRSRGGFGAILVEGTGPDSRASVGATAMLLGERKRGGEKTSDETGMKKIGIYFSRRVMRSVYYKRQNRQPPKDVR